MLYYKQTRWYVRRNTMNLDTKSILIDTATTLFQQKGYKNVGLNEILKACNLKRSALSSFSKWKRRIIDHLFTWFK